MGGLRSSRWVFGWWLCGRLLVRVHAWVAHAQVALSFHCFNIRNILLSCDYFISQGTVSLRLRAHKENPS